MSNQEVNANDNLHNKLLFLVIVADSSKYVLALVLGIGVHFLSYHLK